LGDAYVIHGILLGYGGFWVQGSGVLGSEFKVLGSEFKVLGSEFKTADGLKNGQSTRKRNFVVSDKGAFKRSNLILFVLVLVLVLEISILSRTKDEYEDDKVLEPLNPEP
jgi:hypothetical protein